MTWCLVFQDTVITPAVLLKRQAVKSVPLQGPLPLLSRESMDGQEEDNGRKSLESETAGKKCGQNRRRASRDKAYGTGPSPGFYRP